MGCRGLHRDCRDGLEHRGVLQRWCSGDGDYRGYHVAPSGSGGSRAPPAPEVVPSSSRVVKIQGGQDHAFLF
jgi:hypothetical protein